MSTLQSNAPTVAQPPTHTAATAVTKSAWISFLATVATSATCISVIWRESVQFNALVMRHLGDDTIMWPLVNPIRNRISIFQGLALIAFIYALGTQDREPRWLAVSTAWLAASLVVVTIYIAP